MKKSKIKKIALSIFNEVKRLENESMKKNYVEVAEEPFDLSCCEYDEEVSKKVLEFATNLIKLKGRLNIRINLDNICISGDLEQFKNHSSSGLSNKIREDYIELIITKTGFKLYRKNHQIAYKDTNLYESLLPFIVGKIQNISKELLSEIVDDVMVITKLSRESNLDKLLD